MIMPTSGCVRTACSQLFVTRLMRLTLDLQQVVQQDLRPIQTGRDLATRREFSVFNDI
jgi:hypothetical protein